MDEIIDIVPCKGQSLTGCPGEACDECQGTGTLLYSLFDYADEMSQRMYG
jgi:hypothetical protein